MLRLVAPAFLITLCLACYEGAVAYSYYQVKGCDPLASKQISNPNQAGRLELILLPSMITMFDLGLVPFIVMDIFAKLPGMPGLFLASLFSASLSTLSSGLSSLAALTWADIFKPLIGDISEIKATVIIKTTAKRAVFKVHPSLKLICISWTLALRFTLSGVVHDLYNPSLKISSLPSIKEDLNSEQEGELNLTLCDNSANKSVCE
ncbi:sodium-coupled monocarboxylate transporter 1 [Elysia marginata]|uniref:Sodium-coupled monocarboxylate transporter 1 n=1 Tax=Elysia marginata TaxID=1093978 RepID=A0AAV4G3K7_9GAST|nr:sodium-coupled monocarboxylate transporter 1 [Elysia marginata]